MARSVASRAEGNPFFAEELARLLCRRGRRPAWPPWPACRSRAGGHRGAHRRADSRAQAALAKRRGEFGADVAWSAAGAGRAVPPATSARASQSWRTASWCADPPSAPGRARKYSLLPRHGPGEVRYAEDPRGVRARKHAAFARWLEGTVGSGRAATCATCSPGSTARPRSSLAPPATPSWRGLAADSAVDYLIGGGRPRHGPRRACGLTALRARPGRRGDAASRAAGAPEAQGVEALFQEGRYRSSAASLLGGRRRASAWPATTARPRRGAPRRRAVRARRPGVTLQLRAALAMLEGEPPCPETVTGARQARPLALAGRRPARRSGEARGGARPRAAARRPGARPRPRLSRRHPLHHGRRRGLGGTTSAPSRCAVSERGRMDEASLLTFSTTRTRCSSPRPRGGRMARSPRGWQRRRRRRLEAFKALPARPTAPWACTASGTGGRRRAPSVDPDQALGLLGEWDETLPSPPSPRPELERSEAASTSSWCAPRRRASA